MKKLKHKVLQIFIFYLIIFIFTGYKWHNSSKIQHLKKVKVIKVIDGDTVILNIGEKLRYAGINTLELHTKTGKPQPFAKEAYKLNKKLTEGKTLYLELGLRERDRYGRLLGELYFENGTSVSEILVKKGLALVCYYPGNVKYYEKYLPFQREALKKRKGIFSLLDKIKQAPYYIGNKKSKRFHHPACPEGRYIKRKIIFSSLEEAFYKGYCPCRRCIELILNF